jgi:hypothetical protein
MIMQVLNILYNPFNNQVNKTTNSMKKMMMVAIATVLTTGLFAQNMPSAGDNAFGFTMTGLSNVSFGNFGNTIISNATISDPIGVITAGYDTPLNAVIPQQALMYKRYYDNGLASRLQLGINSLNVKSSFSDSTGIPMEYATSEESVKGFTIGLGIGLEKHMSTDASKVDPFVGADLLFGFLTGFNYTGTSDVVGDGYSSNSEFNVDYPGGMGLALNAICGFNYFFSDNISIGAEVGLGFGMVKTGGEWTSESIYTYDDGVSSTTTTINDRGEYSNSSSGIQVNSRGTVNASIYW